MGEADRYQEYRKRKKIFSLGATDNAITALFVTNAAFFFLLLFMKVGVIFVSQSSTAYEEKILHWVTLPGNFSDFLYRPWTILTYFFTDTISQFIRIISNMLWLWAFASIMQLHGHNNKIIPVYIYGGFLGGIFYILSFMLVPKLGNLASNFSLLGANTATLAVAMSTAMLAPQHRFFTHIRNGISIWIFLVIYVVVDIIGLSDIAYIPYFFAHIGGLLAGYIFAMLLKKQIDLSKWMHNLYNNISNAFAPPKKQDDRQKIFYNSGNVKPFSKTSLITQSRVDEILDKISLKGYNSLSVEEKDILQKASEDKNL